MISVAMNRHVVTKGNRRTMRKMLNFNIFHRCKTGEIPPVVEYWTTHGKRPHG